LLTQKGTPPFSCRLDPQLLVIALIKHARYYWLLLAESHLTRRLFAGMLRRIATLPSPAG